MFAFLPRPFGRSVSALMVAAACHAVPGSAFADELSVAPAWGTLTAVPEATEMFNRLVYDAGPNGTSPAYISLDFTGGAFWQNALLPAAEQLMSNPAVLALPVASVSVAGQGPGPVRIEFAPEAGFIAQDPAGSPGAMLGRFVFSGAAFDVGTKSFTIDLEISLPADALGTGTPAQTHSFNDLVMFKALEVTGSIDGGMPLDNAQVLQTLVPQQLELSADLYFYAPGFADMFRQLGAPEAAIESWSAMPMLKANTLHVTTAVPEASTVATMGLGLAALGLVAARRRQARA